MSAQSNEIKDLADEAEFQVLATMDVCNWIAAIARAIARDVESGGGSDVPVLADLAKYFDDAAATSLEAAFEQFKKIAALVPAPRSEKCQNVACDSEVHP